MGPKKEMHRTMKNTKNGPPTREGKPNEEHIDMQKKLDSCSPSLNFASAIYTRNAKRK